MIPTIYLYYLLYFILFILLIFFMIIFIKGTRSINNKLGKLLVIWASTTIIISSIIFTIFAAQIIWRDLTHIKATKTVLDE